ncbi:MAG: HAD-IA family hydrolase [Pseudonocardiaceae bacterium]|nr:HAD-IA family hydrolase [Pseudonocardiaceae bacterium]
MTAPVRAVWSDFGGVITPPTADTLRTFCARAGLTPDQFSAAMRTIGDRYGTDPMAPLDTPLITEAAWSAQMTEVLRVDHGMHVDLSGFAAKWFADRATNRRWVEWMRGLRERGVFVGLLSNMVPSWDEYWRTMVSADELFDDLVLSFEVGCRKPDAAIFDLAAARAGFASGECVLVDDLAVNCAGAEAAGWQSVQFTDTSAVIATLEAAMAEVSNAPV